MKHKLKIKHLTALMILISTVSYSDEIRIRPQSVRLVPNNTFLPAGFDDNDNVQLVISGYLPNTCYKAGSATAQVDKENGKIFIQNTAYVYAGRRCAQILVPYMHTVNVGILPKGQYQVLVQDQADKFYDQGTLEINESVTTESDEYFYAPVQDVLVKSQSTSGQTNLVIRGNFYSTCMRLNEVKVLYRSSHVVEVLPIIDINESDDCLPASVPFNSEISIQSPWKGSTLIYVRSLNSQAVSKVVEF